MPTLLRNALVGVAVPFLWAISLALQSALFLLRFGFSIAGWELTWPPVLVENLEDEDSLLRTVEGSPSEEIPNQRLSTH